MRSIFILAFLLGVNVFFAPPLLAAQNAPALAAQNAPALAAQNAPALAAQNTPVNTPAFTLDQTRFVSVAPRVVVDGAVVRLGDIFKGAGKNATRVIAYAPRPGSRAVFDARWLKRVARAFNLNWRPAGPAQNVIIERASRIVTKSEIEALLHDRLVADGGDGASRAVLSNRALRLYLPLNTASGNEATLNVEQLVRFPGSERFDAVIAWGNADGERLRLTGRFERMIDVPVLSERIMRGSVIRKDDLKWIQFPEKRLPNAVITDASLIIGMAAKHSMQSDKPVTQSDIRRPLLVNRGEIITLLLSTPYMQLSTKGRALEAGARGDTIRISNLQTSTVISAVIIGSGQARVETAVNLAMR